MTRPVHAPIASGTQGWDSFVDDNFYQTFSQPFPIHESSGLTESNVAATFPPSAYDRCLVWVNHSVYGYTLYASNGTTWIPFPAKRITRSVTTATTFTSTEPAQIILSGGTLPYTHTLPTAASMIGRTLIFKTLVAGTLTIDGNGAETIDGAANVTLTAITQSVRLYSNGTEWLTV